MSCPAQGHTHVDKLYMSYTSLEPSRSASAQHAALPAGLHVLLGCECKVDARASALFRQTTTC